MAERELYMVPGREHERLEDEIKGLLALQADLESEVVRLTDTLRYKRTAFDTLAESATRLQEENERLKQRLAQATDLLQKWYEHKQYWQATGQWLQGVNG